MKMLAFAAVAALSMAAIAQEPAEGGEGLPPPPPMHERAHRGPMHEGMRGQMPGGMRQMNGSMQDPLVHMVMNPTIAEKIGLTDDQKAKLKALQPKRGENKELNEKVQSGMKKQMELLQAEKIDEAAVMAAIDEVFDARKEMAKAQTKRLIAVRSILTSEQIKAASEAMKEMRGQRTHK